MNARWSLPSRHEVTSNFTNAKTRALGFADLTVGQSEMRLAA